MFSKVKAWFRAIIAEEVAKVSVSLAKDRVEAIATLKNIENEIARSFEVTQTAFEDRIKATLEAAHAEFVLRLKATREHIADGEPNRWNATPETLAADHALKVVK